MAREDMDAMIQTVMPLAEQMLKKHGEFQPFGALINQSGEVTLIGSGETESDAQEIIELLTDGLRVKALAGEIRAAVICLDVTITPLGKQKSQMPFHSLLSTRAANASRYLPRTKRGFLDTNTGKCLLTPEN